MMKRNLAAIVICLISGLMLAGCKGNSTDNKDAVKDKPAEIAEAATEEIETEPSEEKTEEKTEEKGTEETNSEPIGSCNVRSDPAAAASEGKNINEEQALSAVQKYCYTNNPDLKRIVDDGEYEVYWETENGTDDEIIVLFRSYTGAQIRYHIDRTSGETYVTECVPGISDKEERTDEVLNVWDYLDD